MAGGGGLIRGIKIPPQDFALKMQGGGAYAQGGRICKTLWYLNGKKFPDLWNKSFTDRYYLHVCIGWFVVTCGPRYM